MGTTRWILKCLLDYGRGGVFWWYAPKWIQSGDLMFFYCTGRGQANLRRIIKAGRYDQESLKLLAFAQELGEGRASSIFAIGEVGTEENLVGQVANAHFAGSFFAPIKRVSVLDAPVAIPDFRDITTVSQSTITPLMGERFLRLRERLAETNTLPDWIMNTSPTNQGFRDINRENWRGPMSAERIGFLLEEQVRAYYLDHLFREIADPRGSFLEECNCYSDDGTHLGRADYCLRIGGQWFPVEAKLDVDQSGVVEQAGKYATENSFRTTNRRDTQKEYRIEHKSRLCLVGDRNGLYLMGEEGYIAGDAGSPWISRVDCCSRSATEIVEQLDGWRK